MRIPRTLVSRFIPVIRNAAFRRQPAAWARVAEILERSLQAAARSDPANARRTFQAAQRGESPSSVNAAFHRRFRGSLLGLSATHRGHEPDAVALVEAGIMPASEGGILPPGWKPWLAGSQDGCLHEYGSWKAVLVWVHAGEQVRTEQGASHEPEDWSAGFQPLWAWGGTLSRLQVGAPTGSWAVSRSVRNKGLSSIPEIHFLVSVRWITLAPC